MKDVLWTIFELSINLFQSVLVIQTIRSFLGENAEIRKNNNILGIGFTLFLFLELSFVNSIVPFEGLGIILSIIIIYVYALICLNGSFCQKLFWTLFIMLLIMGITAMVLNIEGYIIGEPYLNLVIKRDMHRFIGVIIIQIILFYLTRFIIKRRHQRGNYTMKWNEWIILLIIPIVSIFTMTFVLLVSINAEQELTQIQQIYSVMAIIGIMITNILVYGLYIKLQKEHKNQMNYEILQQILSDREKSIEEAKILYQSIRSMRHDLKQHNGVILTMLYNKRYEKAIKYLEEYDGIVNENILNKVFCNNDVVNYLINSKYKMCREREIDTYFFIKNDIPAVSDLDLCVLLGNALDNAIEGCCSNQKKEIYLELRLIDNFFMIIVKNTICNSVLANNPQLNSTKKEKGKHGLGIASMREVIKKYKGSIDFREENGLFCCNILLDILE